MKTTKKDELLDYMRGYARTPAGRRALASDYDWRPHARIELERRRAAFLGVLPDELQEGIASGELDISELAKQLDR